MKIYDYILCSGSGKPVPAVRHVAVGSFRPEYCRLRRRRAAPVRRRRPAAAHTRRAGTFRNADVQHRRFGGRDVRQRHPLRGAAGAGALSGSDGRTIRRHLRRPGIPHHVRGADLRRAAHLRGGDSAVAARRRLPAVAPGRRIRRTARSRSGRRAGLHLLAAGQPHIVALVAPDSAWLFGSDGRLDTRRLAELGEQANRMRGVFPRGINVSLFCRLDEGRIFAATYERGVGITSSCGTAMTSCATAAALLGLAGFDTTVEVWNRGGRVLPAAPHAAGNRHPPDGRRLFRNGGTAPARREECIATGDASPLDPPCDRLRLTEETLRELHEKYGLTIADDHD